MEEVNVSNTQGGSGYRVNGIPQEREVDNIQIIDEMF